MDVQYGGLTFHRPGHATVRIETSDKRVIYIDPWSRIIDTAPHDADYIFVTHDDMDHYDPKGIEMVRNDNTIIALYDPIDDAEVGQVKRTIRLDYDGMTTVGGISVKSTPAFNKADGPHLQPDGKPYHAKGDVIGIVLDVEGVKIFYPSDTDFLPSIHRDIDADVVIPPIGGSYTMDETGALSLVQEIAPDLVLPVHYKCDFIEGLDANAEEFKSNIERLGFNIVLF